MVSPAPVTPEKKEKTASEASPSVIKETQDTDCEGTSSTDVIENSKKHEDEKKEQTETDSTETVSEKIEKDSPDNTDPAESSDKEEEKDVTNEVKVTVTVSDVEEKVKDKEPTEEKSVESKLDAEALSASLSSSRCLLKRNRDDLDVDSDADNQEEPDCKKSHTAASAAVKTDKKEEQSEDEGTAEEKEDIGAPVVVEKSLLPPAELVASLSSSKSVLKRSIDQVTESAEGLAAPEVKKSNIVSKKTDEEPCEDVVNTTEPSDDLKTPVKPSRTVSNVSAINIPSPRMLIMSPPSPIPASRCPLPVLESTRLSPLKDGELIKEDAVREDSKKSPKIPKEEVRVIAAKDLAEDRKLEKRRLNKLLTIFDDQKPVK